jgi:hypothetical protein
MLLNLALVHLSERDGPVVFHRAFFVLSTSGVLAHLSSMKKFLQALTPKDITKYILLLLQVIGGIWIGHFYGGLITGSAGLCLVVAVIGKTIFAQTVGRIDKNVKDTLLSQ